MLNQNRTTDINKLLALSPEELQTYLEMTVNLRENVSLMMEVYGISKEEIMSACGLSQDQYYRRMNRKKWDTDNLLKIVNLIARNKVK